MKHIVLDCPAAMARQIIVKHVQTVMLGECGDTRGTLRLFSALRTLKLLSNVCPFVLFSITVDDNTLCWCCDWIKLHATTLNIEYSVRLDTFENI